VISSGIQIKSLQRKLRNLNRFKAFSQPQVNPGKTVQQAVTKVFCWNDDEKTMMDPNIKTL